MKSHCEKSTTRRMWASEEPQPRPITPRASPLISGHRLLVSRHRATQTATFLTLPDLTLLLESHKKKNTMDAMGISQGSSIHLLAVGPTSCPMAQRMRCIDAIDQYLWPLFRRLGGQSCDPRQFRQLKRVQFTPLTFKLSRYFQIKMQR